MIMYIPRKTQTAVDIFAAKRSKTVFCFQATVHTVLISKMLFAFALQFQ